MPAAPGNTTSTTVEIVKDNAGTALMVHKQTAVTSYANFLPNMQMAKFAQACPELVPWAVETGLIVERTDLATQMSNVT